MLRLYKNFQKRDWIGVVLIIALTFFQVYLSMTIVDFVRDITQAIAYLNYHNNPAELGELAKFVEMYGWENLGNIEFLKALGAPADSIDIILNVANASVADIWYNGGMMLLLAFLLMVVQGVISFIASYVAADLSTAIRTKVYRKIESFSLAEINQFSTPSLVTRTTNDIQNIQMANLMTMRMIFAAPITAVWAIIKIQATSIDLTIATVVAIIMLIIFIGSLMIIVMPKFKSMQKLTDRLNQVTRENLTGIRIIRAFNAELYQEHKFDEANKVFTNTQLFTGRILALMSPFMMLIMNGIVLAIYWIGANLINQGTIDYATVSSFMMLSTQIIMSFVMLMMLFILWPRASVSAQRINEVLNMESTIHNPIEEDAMTSNGTIEFNNVSFNYPNSDVAAISNISFKVEKGETLAIIGSTGSGKTTLVNLIARLYDATTGEVLVDGANVKNLNKETLRKKIGYVPQKGFLFKGTVKENVSLGNPNMPLDDIVKACKIADADSFVSEKNEKYDYMISQGGKNVSGGQRQRLCIARAIAINPEILIFDDSFSALDYRTDKKVRESLKHEMKDATRVIVAQRIGTIMDADKIIVLDDGHIVGIGKHEQLLHSCEVYKEIALSQLSKEELGLVKEAL